MLKVTELPANLRWELKRLLEIFLKNGSLTATLDRLDEITIKAVRLLEDEGFCTIDTTTVEAAVTSDIETVKANNEAKARDDLVTERTKDFKREGLTEEELKKTLVLHNMDGGDVNGRYRFNTDKLELVSTVIAEIIRSVRPK